MKLSEFCTQYPTDRDTWPLCTPSKALPFVLREVLFPKFGNILASHDRSKKKVANRMGTSLRPFQPGDRINALSLSHYMRTDELMSRVDDALGQMTARIIVVSEETLDYKSAQSRCNKGQVLLGVAGIIESIHTRQGHSCRIIYTSRSDLKNHVSILGRSKKSQMALYVLSDFLEGSLFKDLESLNFVGLHGASYFCIRDITESTHPLNTLKGRSMMLTPFSTASAAQVEDAPQSRAGQSQNGVKYGYSGDKYIENISAELAEYRKHVNKNQGLFVSFTEQSQLHDVVHLVNEAYVLSDFQKN